MGQAIAANQQVPGKSERGAGIGNLTSDCTVDDRTLASFPRAPHVLRVAGCR